MDETKLPGLRFFQVSDRVGFSYGVGYDGGWLTRKKPIGQVRAKSISEVEEEHQSQVRGIELVVVHLGMIGAAISLHVTYFGTKGRKEGPGA